MKVQTFDNLRLTKVDICEKKKSPTNFINKKDPILKKEFHTNYKNYRSLLSALMKKTKQVYYELNQIPYFSKNCSIQCINCTPP